MHDAGLPKKQLIKLIEVSLDGERLEAEAVEKKNERGVITDQYHLTQLPQLSPGKHMVSVTVRRLETGEEVRRTFEVAA